MTRNSSAATSPKENQLLRNKVTVLKELPSEVLVSTGIRSPGIGKPAAA